MLDLYAIQRRLQDMNLRAVSRSTGLHYSVVHRAARDKEWKPSHATAKVLSDYLEERDA